MQQIHRVLRHEVAVEGVVVQEVTSSEVLVAATVASVRAACHADRCPETSAHSEIAETNGTESISPVVTATGIITIQSTVAQPFSRCITEGSPCTADQARRSMWVPQGKVGARTYGRRVDYEVVPVEWTVVYPAHVEPIGKIRRVRSGFRAKLEAEDLGIFDTGDEAAEALWARFLEQNAARHEHASVTHGGHDRHRS